MDRIDAVQIVVVIVHASLSARRAWIEMTYVTRLPRAQVVALRKESVDRNRLYRFSLIFTRQSLSARRAWIEINRVETAKTSNAESLSARRAWIEIKSGLHPLMASLVALRKESVDRNACSSSC